MHYVTNTDLHVYMFLSHVFWKTLNAKIQVFTNKKSMYISQNIWLNDIIIINILLKLGKKR